MAVNIHVSKGTVAPIGNRVIVSDMHFGEMQTKGGILLTSDDGKDRGIKPRWAKVVAKGPKNTDPYEVGHWILIEHGRWTRGFNVEEESGEVKTYRTVEAESVMLWDTEKPEDMLFGQYDGASADMHRPEDFM